VVIGAPFWGLTIYFARLKAGGNQLSLSMDIDLRHPAGLWRKELVMGDVFGRHFFGASLRPTSFAVLPLERKTEG
jgi:hypothetical protein